MFVPFFSLVSQDSIKEPVSVLIEKTEKDIDTLKQDIRDIEIRRKVVDDQIRFKDSIDNLNK